MNNKKHKTGLSHRLTFFLLMMSGLMVPPLVYAQSQNIQSATNNEPASAAPSTGSDGKATISATDTTSNTTIADGSTTNNGTTSTDTENLPAIDMDNASPTVSDPLEHLNRGIFNFNDTVDNYILKPIATIYNKVLPRPINRAIHNFYNNISELPTIANDVLQLHLVQFMNDTWRLGINSTVGLLGFFDVATNVGTKGLPFYENDFGLTLARWGYSNSFYLVLPFFGPSSPRDGIGLPIDYFAFSIYPRVNPESARYELYGVGVVDRRAQLLKFQSVLEEAAVDRYTFIRNAYTQRRAYQIQQNRALGFFGSTSSENIKGNTIISTSSAGAANGGVVTADGTPTALPPGESDATAAGEMTGVTDATGNAETTSVDGAKVSDNTNNNNETTTTSAQSASVSSSKKPT